MKRIIALLLAVLSVFAFVACTGDDGAGDITPFKNALNSAPVSATITSKIESGDITLEGEYNVTYADGVATVAYTNEVLGIIPEDGDVPAEKTEVPGAATVAADGAVSAGAIGNNYAVLIARKIALDSSKMISYSISGDVLVATFTSANSTALTAGYANTDVALNVSISGGKVMGISVSYGTAAGTVSIVCTYNY